MLSVISSFFDDLVFGRRCERGVATSAATASALSTAKNFARAIAVAEQARGARVGERGLGMGWLASAKWRGGYRVS